MAQAYNAVNPEQSLEPGDPRYVDFAAQRGDEHPVSVIVKRILRSEASQPVRHLKQLLAGHRGCGKTTELLLLKDRLEKANFFVVYFDAALEIDMNDVDYSDLLLATIHQLHQQVEQSPLPLSSTSNAWTISLCVLVKSYLKKKIAKRLKPHSRPSTVLAERFHFF